MPDTLPPCPDCGARFTYAVDALLNCPACGHEWSPDAALDAADVIRDAVGNILQDGDTVTVIKDLKVKGTSVTLKRGTLVKNIRLTGDPDLIECNAEKVKGLVLRTEFLKKA